MKNNTKSISSTRQTIFKLAILLFGLMMAVTALVACAPKSDVELLAAAPRMTKLPDVGNDDNPLGRYTLKNTITANNFPTSFKGEELEFGAVLVLKYRAFTNYGGSWGDDSAPDMSIATEVNSDVIEVKVSNDKTKFDIALYGENMDVFKNNIDDAEGVWTSRSYRVEFVAWYERATTEEEANTVRLETVDFGDFNDDPTDTSNIISNYSDQHFSVLFNPNEYGNGYEQNPDLGFGNPDWEIVLPDVPEHIAPSQNKYVDIA